MLLIIMSKFTCDFLLTIINIKKIQMKKKIRTVFTKLKKPNTWGREDYQGESIQSTKNHRRDKFRPDEFKKMGFVQRIMTKYVTGFSKTDNKNHLWKEYPNT